MVDKNHSEYIVYVDESGDHGLKTIDPNYPVFVLVFCIFKKEDYISQVVPNFQHFKFKHFGHDQSILHETDIRKDRCEFSFLKSKDSKDSFLNELTDIIEIVPFKLVCTVINKEAYRHHYQNPDNPYHVALGYGLERVYAYLKDQQQHKVMTHIVVEKRGKVEDNELELEFRRICDGRNYNRVTLPFEIVFADKKSNSVGLQLADLIARPIGINKLKPEQANRAHEVIEYKFYTDRRGDKKGWGLKCFP